MISTKEKSRCRITYQEQLFLQFVWCEQFTCYPTSNPAGDWSLNKYILSGQSKYIEQIYRELLWRVHLIYPFLTESSKIYLIRAKQKIHHKYIESSDEGHIRYIHCWYSGLDFHQSRGLWEETRFLWSEVSLCFAINSHRWLAFG